MEYKIFSEVQREWYERLSPTAKAYLEFRRQGNGKADSYRLATGYSGKNASQSARSLEKKQPHLEELIEILFRDQSAEDFISEGKGDLQTILDTKARQQGATAITEAVKNFSPEETERLRFYKDVADGKRGSVIVKTKRDGDGKVLFTITEERIDIDECVKARKEMDRMLGLNRAIEIESLAFKNCTIKLVDASSSDSDIEAEISKIEEGIVEVEESEIENG